MKSKRFHYSRKTKRILGFVFSVLVLKSLYTGERDKSLLRFLGVLSTDDIVRKINKNGMTILVIFMI